MLILKADRLGTTARVPVSYPVMFQTDWYMDEGEVLDLSLPGCAIESARCLIRDEDVRLHVLLPQSPGSRRGRQGAMGGAQPNPLEFLKIPEADKDRVLGLVTDFYA